MPGEKHTKTHSNTTREEPPRDEKSVKKHKKKKSGSEKNHKRKHESDELKQVQKSKPHPDDVAGDMVGPESTEEEKKGGDGNAERKGEEVNEPSLPKSEEKKKKKKKKKQKERQADEPSDQPSDEKQDKSKSEIGEAPDKKDHVDTEGAGESPRAENKRKKKRKDRKRTNSNGGVDEIERTLAEEGVANAKKESQSEELVKSSDAPGGEAGNDEEMPKKDLVDGTEAGESKRNGQIGDTASKKKGKKRKREEEKSNHSVQQLGKDSEGEPREAKQKHLPEKRMKHDQKVASNPVNVHDATTLSESGEEIRAVEPTKQKAESETPPGASAKEVSGEPSGDQEDDGTPLDDKRLFRTLFVGNVPHTANRKDLRKIFSKFGSIESVRIRNIVPDNPKLPKKAALLAQRLAKFSDSFAAYVVFKEAPDMDKVLHNAVNGTNMTIFQDHHLRVTKALQKKGKRRLSVFIGNLPFDCSDEELINTFMPIAKECGVNLLNVRVTRDKDTGVGRGVGFATFDDMMAIQACMNKAGEITVRGRVLRIERAFKEKMMKSKTYKRKQKAKFGRKK